MSSQFWIQTIWHADDIPEIIFWKSWSANDKRAWKMKYPVGIEFRILISSEIPALI